MSRVQTLAASSQAGVSVRASSLTRTHQQSPNAREHDAALEPSSERDEWDLTQTPIHAKLVVGSPNDPHEAEADRVAEQVMASAPVATSDAAFSQSPAAAVQPSCAECEEEKKEERREEVDDSELVRRACKHCGDDEESSIRRKAAANTLSGERESVIEGHTLSTGGSPLPDSLRAFFEPRFDRDFCAVRVHTGPLADRYADRLHAHAFTYGRHVWIGRGQRLAASPLIAHELAHVVQQSPLPALAARRKSPTDRFGLRDREPRVRRFTPFWEPYEIRGGADNHKIVLPVMGEENKMFTEAPVPNANLLSEGYNKKGQADFVSADNTVGAYFTGHGTPTALSASRELLKDGKSYAHKSKGAPKVNVAAALYDSANAPNSVAIGDLKPSHGTIEALEGTGQVLHYKAGFELAHKEANDPATFGDGKQWNPFSARVMGSKDLKIPGRFAHPSFTDQRPMKLVLKQGSSKRVVYDPKPAISGHICVRPDPSNVGIWNYTWVPSTTPKAADLPPTIKRLGPEVTKKIVDPLTSSPLKAAKKAKPGARPLVLTHAAPLVQLKSKAVAPEKDSFDYAQWNSDRKKLTDEFNAEKKTQEFKDAEGKLLAAQAHDAIREKFGLPLPEMTASKEPARILDKVEFWTGLSAAPFGIFRRVFGTAFVKVAQVVVKVRDRIREFLKNRKTHAGTKTGFLGAALKAAFRVMKMAAVFVVGRVVDRLMQALVTGVTNRLSAMIAGEFQDDLQGKAEEVRKLAEELERKALDSVEGLLKKVLGTQLDDLKKIDEVYNLVSDIIGLVNLVRWGARVVACVSPPALGCLWILGEAALDFAAQKVAETCWFQQKIAPLFAKVKYVTTELPNTLADLVLGKIRDFLPASLKDTFAPLDAEGVTLTTGDIECDEEDTTEYSVHPLHDSIDALYLKIGEERAKALSGLLKKAGPADRALSSSEIAELGDAIVKNNVTAEQLRKYETDFPTPTGIPLGVTQFVERVQKGTPPPPEKAGATGAETPAPVPAEEQHGVGAGKGGAGDKESDKQGAGGGEGMRVLDASSRRTTEKATTKVEGTAVQVVNPSSAHTKGTKPKIHVLVYADGKVKAMVRDVDTVVIRRELFPRTSTSLETAAGLLIYYGAEQGVDLNDVVGGIIPAYDPKHDKETTIPALVLTRLGEQALGRVREKQSADAGR